LLPLLYRLFAALGLANFCCCNAWKDGLWMREWVGYGLRNGFVIFEKCKIWVAFENFRESSQIWMF
jgi:hypothetical protein